jgi:hypothetical protein
VSLLVVLLVLCLFAVVAFAAYQFSASTRWKHKAEMVYEEVSRCRTELEAARRTALEKEAEAVKTREVAEGWKLTRRLSRRMKGSARVF